MKNLKWLLPCLLMTLSANALALTPRMVFEKYLFAEGVDPHARYLDRLIVKFFDEDMVRLRDGKLLSTVGSTPLTYTQEFLARHPEIKLEVIITSLTEEQYAEMIARAEQKSGIDQVDLFSFYCFRLPAPAADPKALLADILKAPEVEVAYYDGIPYPTTCTDAGGVTPNYRPNQTYHDPAPVGVDADYAWATFGEDVTDGATSAWTAVIEWGTTFMATHEDFTTVVMGTPEESADTFNYHGTAVAGIVGACEENNVGIVGFTADQAIHYYSVTALASIADVYTRVNSQLIEGEYTTGSWAYFANPLPPGQTCPCNPGQNGHVPAEYVPATKTAIANGIALGIHYLESAGNGCTNLDSPTFGNTFRWSTDTGAMIIGGIESTAPHDAICYTGYGERVTLNAWSENIVTLGYGTLRTGSGRREYYSNSFGGTSGAGPIVAGCGGVLNNIYRGINAGANISPTTLRSWLASGGTAPGTTPGNIGVMPNLFAITAPDLNADQRTGWTNVIVPRNTGDATGASAVLPTNLNSIPDPTYWNSSIENTSQFSTADPAYWRLYRDDVYFIWAGGGSLGPMGRIYHANTQGGSGDVRGGRHTIRCGVDPLDEVVEFWEAANSGVQQNWVQQHVWDPRPLTAESPLTFTQPPLRLVTGQPGAYYNCDGYSLTTGFSGYWDLLGVCASTTAADYDTRIYSEAITSTNGFDDYEAWSPAVGPIDIVGKNGNLTGAVSGAAVINWDGENDSYRVEGETSTYLGTPGYGRNDAGAFVIDADEIMEAVEFNVNELVSYEIEADVSAGSANLVISVFGPEDNYFALTDRNASVNANGAGGSERLCFTPTQTGYHLALFHKYDSNDYSQTSTFHAYIGKSEFDLTHKLLTGWSHELVVTQSTGSQPFVLPATLTGNVSTNYLHQGMVNLGCVASPFGLNTGFYRDGPSIFTSGSMVSWPAGSDAWVFNQGPIFVFGGRHSVGDSIDVFQEGAEWREDNNRWDEQFVWTPYSLTNQTPVLTANPAPNWRNTESSVFFSAWNQDGWRFNGGHWSGVAMVPTNAADNYLCMLYNPTTGSTNGFDTQLVPSFNTAGGGLNFVVENGNVNGLNANFDVGVTNNWPWPGTPSVGAYRTYQCNRILDLTNNALNGPFTLGLNHLIHVYDLYLLAGDTSRIILDNLGATDLGLAVYAAGIAYGSRTHNGTVMNSAGDGGDETIVYVPTVSGYYGIVVFKNDLTDMAGTDYRLIIGDRIPAAPQRLVLQVINSAVNPIQMLAHWDSVLTDINGAPLNVDSYQLYYVLDTNPAPFPTGWVPYITTNQATVNFLVMNTVVNLRMVVVARDSDGLILAHSPLPDGSDLTGTKLPADLAPAEPAIISDRGPVFR